ncbi:S8 family serine peptidase [Vampirovibrio sp.]|uniref:S8 family peptidase n=1 Tax=Vampirovibrio sp. TaxID=2717857 RepID=UPI0035943278
MVFPIQPISAYPTPQAQPAQAKTRMPIPKTPEGNVLWRSVADAYIRPQGSQPNPEIYAPIIGSVLENGQIVADTLWGPQTQGVLNTDGNYQLRNGVQGNLFENAWLSVPLNERSNPFTEALKATERKRAVQGSEIPQIRQRLTRLGLNGQGLKIGILDAQVKDSKTQQWKSSPHTQLVKSTINDPVWGVAPGAQVEDLGLTFEPDEKDLPADSYQAFVNDLSSSYQKIMQDRTQQITTAIAKKDPSLRVLNATWGSTRSRMYHAAIHTILMQTNEDEYPKYPALRQSVLGPAMHGTTAQQFQTIINTVDAVLDNSPLVKAAHAQYVDATRQAANAGIIIVSAASNEGNGNIPGLSYQAGSQMSKFSESPYVITVAAADTRQQPGNRAAYKVSDFSSKGDGQAWNPTIAAPGQEMGISVPAGKMGHNLTVQGTSFATPFTCGVIALMLQRNPYLTFQQIKAKLEATAVKSPYYGPADYGAGFLNAEAAVLS